MHRVLFLTTATEDYLQDTILYGMRSILGDQVVDYPKKMVMYETCNRPNEQLYGNGFTIWKSLKDIPIDRNSVEREIRNKLFSLIIFGSIGRQQDLFKRLFPSILRSRIPTIFLDGEDNATFRTKQLLGIAFPYYKREADGFGKAFSRKIQFSIPQAKVLSVPRPKQRLFSKHVQCDVAYEIPWIRENCQQKYAFGSESAYREDIATSSYAITMKKAGWDCMRHYEIAASCTVMAFHNLDQKPSSCPPYGLRDMQNAVAFSSATELLYKIQEIESQGLYTQIQAASMQWIRERTCETQARTLLKRHLLGFE